MLRTRAAEVSLWEAVLPEEVRRLPEELARVGPVWARHVNNRYVPPTVDRRVLGDGQVASQLGFGPAAGPLAVAVAHHRRAARVRETDGRGVIELHRGLPGS